MTKPICLPPPTGEALCRISALKALPSDTEITQSRRVDAFDWMNRLKIDDSQEYLAFLEQRKRSWGQDPKFQPLQHSVEQLLELIVGTIESSGGTWKRKSREEPLFLSDNELDKWKSRMFLPCVKQMRV